ncbi:MAG: ribonuclease D [Alphaproteobacteria bacterium]
MNLITDQRSLEDFCAQLAGEKYITVDTEFLREKTYWPILCVVQLAGAQEAAAIDALAEDIDLAPVYRLMGDTKILKVFHAARQDIEIFFHDGDVIPAPMFDTQVAAMVCGFGDSASYELLVQKLAKEQIDKSSRFTDWSRRPLTERQIEYAISDVTHLRVIYDKLAGELESSGRAGWLEAEMAVLTSPDTYRADPDKAWRRLKARSRKPRFLAILHEVAAWREREAQSRDVPRNRVVRDEALMEIAAHAPGDAEALERTRGLHQGFSRSRAGGTLIEAVARGSALPEAECPYVPEKTLLPKGLGPVIELLKVLLKMRCDAEDVAQKLIASSADIEAIAASDNADVRALKGWRREVFGKDALALKHGSIGLTIHGRKLEVVDIEEV